MNVLTFETRWALNNKNKASDIKLVYLYLTIKMMHGPINIRFPLVLCLKVNLLVIITKHVLRKLFHFIVVIRFCESHSAAFEERVCERDSSTGSLINPRSLFMSLFADVRWACQVGTFVRQVASSRARVLFIWWLQSNELLSYMADNMQDDDGSRLRKDCYRL